jgi:hypothetical protein
LGLNMTLDYLFELGDKNLLVLLIEMSVL